MIWRQASAPSQLAAKPAKLWHQALNHLRWYRVNSIDKEVVQKLLSGDIGADDLVAGLGRNGSRNETLSVLLDEAVESHDAEHVELVLLAGEILGFDASHKSVLVELLDQQWHYKHEDIVDILGDVGGDDSVSAISRYCTFVPAYLDWDTTRSLARRSMWSLGKIGSKNALSELKKMALNKDATISETADAVVHKYWPEDA